MASIIGVETLQHTNGTTAATIDSSGRILQPAKPAFSVYLNLTTGSTNYTTNTQIPFDTEDFDIGNNVTMSNNAVFTAPVDGIYQFNAILSLQDVTTSGYSNLYFYIDGALVSSSADLTYRVIEDPEGASYQSLTNAALIKLTANQTVSPYVNVNTDTTVRIRRGTRFSGFLVA